MNTFPRPTGEGLRERGLSAHDEIPKQVQHDKYVSEAHSNELNVLTSYRLNDFKKKAAFTLAEVLITLAIIGIVAAMTIPTLIANYQERAWNTSAQVFERKLEEALKTMNTQQSLAGYSNTADFVAALGKHFKITRVCNSNEITSCFSDKINWKIIDISNNTESETINISTIKTAADLGQENWNTEAIGVQFANGTTGIIAYNPECKENPYTNQFTGTSCISLLYDIDGFKNPNTYPKDVRGINSKLINCAFKMGNTCFTAPFKPEPITKAECEQLKGDLGIKECYFANDYWAGAVKACGGVSKMPTDAQLNDIANYVYNTTGISGYIYGLTLDTDKVAELGFTHSNGFFHVWSEKETSSMFTSAYTRIFNPNGTHVSSSGRTTSSLQAVCLGD